MTGGARWWTRSQRIRTAAELPFEAALLGATGYADDALHDGVLDGGALFLQKPVKAAELERVVRRLLE